MKYLSRNATIIDEKGFVQSTGIEVIDLGETIVIGSTEHSRDELIFRGKQIISINGWTVILD
jgi:uncharacterized Zn-binding protein involved in type VI secretion